ncbi:MAG: heparinase II/III family protein, partial [Armatimonadota bacterium]|nr:heparinase II/III family protein [Armatimonadota bacterium]
MLGFALRFCIALIVILAASAPAFGGRDGGGYFTAERIANVRENVATNEWVRGLRDAAVARAEPWIAMSDDELWGMVPCQSLPRAIDVTLTKTPQGTVRLGCLNCGEDIFKHGNYPYITDPVDRPWKIECPSCGMVFPTNDFGAFYRSAIDERGCFDASKGDRSLLFNAEHPDPDDPLHTWGVDDGWGYVDEDGHEYRFIAYYTWRHWRHVRRVLSDLSTAWMYTGEPVYAHKAGVLLDRIADVYPDMDWAPYAERGWFHSDGGSRRGKIEGRIWETGVIRGFAQDYDRVAMGLADCPELLSFLAQKAEQYDLPGEKGTLEDLYRNIEEGILRTGAEALMSEQIRGNHGSHESAMAAVAMASGRDPEMTQWLDWIFAVDGMQMPGTIVGRIDRDGVGSEGSPSYSLGWASNIGRLADMLAEFDPYGNHDIYRDFPQFKKTFTAGWKLLVLGLATPNIGDCGSTGSMGRVSTSPDFIARGYRYLRDPDIALAAYRANGGSGEGLQRSIFDQDPEAIGREIERIGREAGPPEGEGGFNQAGYGLMSLEQGHGRDGTALWMFYGRSFGHGHHDRLNVGLYAFGHKLEPDLGYPEFATSWPKRGEWTDNTISHNTVIVDSQRQQANWGGHPVFFKTLPGLSAGEVRSANAYEQCDVYARTLALVDAGQGAYGVDVFRVRGGTDHLLSFHAAPGDPEVAGLSTVAQEGGTYAGPQVPFGQRQSNDVPLGFSWLYDVERDAEPGAAWSVDWHVPDGYRGVSAEDDLHLRWHNLTQVDEAALAHGDPPQNKSGNPRRLRYVLARRQGDPGLASTFVSAHEPYRGDPLIRSVERIECGEDAEGFEAVAVRLELADGA